MHELVYLSHATKSLSRQELLALLENARQYNAHVDVTGLLLYDGKSMFIQVLEGPEENINALYKKITSDPRHNRFTVLWRNYLTQRNFPDWKMGYKHLDKETLNEVKGLSSYLDETDTQKEIDTSNFSQVLLKHFKEGSL